MLDSSSGSKKLTSTELSELKAQNEAFVFFFHFQHSAHCCGRFELAVASRLDAGAKVRERKTTKCALAAVSLDRVSKARTRRLDVRMAGHRYA